MYSSILICVILAALVLNLSMDFMTQQMQSLLQYIQKLYLQRMQIILAAIMNFITSQRKSSYDNLQRPSR